MAYLPYLDHIDPGQGGSAMVIPSYNWYRIPVKPEVFPCGQCTFVFDTYESWFDHRFHAHPILRPALMLGSHELVTPRFTVTKPLTFGDVHVFNTKSCTVNEDFLSLEDLPEFIASQKSGFYEVRLFGNRENVNISYEISVEISNEDDLRLVEIEFAELSSTGDLNIHTINAFIRSASKAATAKRYTDGLANYLFGLISKDQRGDTRLTQEQGLARLTESHQTLQQIDRPLSRVISAIIEFQLNAFSNLSGLDAVPKLQQAMHWYSSCSIGNYALQVGGQFRADIVPAKVPLDLATSELLNWLSSPQEVLITELKHIEKRMKQADWLPSDRTKASVLAAAILKQYGEGKSAALISRSFRHDPIFGEMAERLIAQQSAAK
jgi:hypothetical protein